MKIKKMFRGFIFIMSTDFEGLDDLQEFEEGSTTVGTACTRMYSRSEWAGCGGGRVTHDDIERLKMDGWRRSRKHVRLNKCGKSRAVQE